jgi:hypothetical protein
MGRWSVDTNRDIRAHHHARFAPYQPAVSRCHFAAYGSKVLSQAGTGRVRWTRCPC